MAVACSTSHPPATPQSDGAPPGQAVTACQIQGYVSELDGGLCPPGTCAVRAFDTNGGLLPCCTSVVSGPGMCLDADATDLADGPDAAAEASGAVEAGAGEGEAEADAPTEAGSDGPAD
jgi:hypothetical protein